MTLSRRILSQPRYIRRKYREMHAELETEVAAERDSKRARKLRRNQTHREGGI